MSSSLSNVKNRFSITDDKGMVLIHVIKMIKKNKLLEVRVTSTIE